MLRRVETHQAEETLGIMLAPDGNLRQQAEKPWNKSVEWAAAMKNGHLSHTEAWVALQSTLWWTLSYPVPAFNLTRKQCEWMMAPAIEYILNALGIC